MVGSNGYSGRKPVSSTRELRKGAKPVPRTLLQLFKSKSLVTSLVLTLVSSLDKSRSPRRTVCVGREKSIEIHAPKHSR
jgi:hypothetical protein